jgi:hypothetical protein
MRDERILAAKAVAVLKGDLTRPGATVGAFDRRRRSEPTKAVSRFPAALQRQKAVAPARCRRVGGGVGFICDPLRCRKYRSKSYRRIQ